ncbi:hypothetical protein C9926_00210 [Sulfurovum lithotrophicum]|nr:hypothetical protein C9926_00210 [Sulfurovum lithotrophicum]
MKTTLLRFGAVVFLTLGLTIHIFLRPIILGTSGEEIVFHYFFFFLSAILFFLSFKYIDQSDANIWLCENCGTKSIRSEIKFGLCPRCGTKLKNFKGMKSLLT